MNKQTLKNLPFILGIIAVLSAFIGFFIEKDYNFVESFYSVFNFFGGGASKKDLENSIFLQISAIATPLSLIILIVVFFFQNLKKWFFLTFIAKKHFIICGLGDMGSTLAKHMLKDKKLKKEGYSKLIIIESNPTNSHIEDMRLLGALVIIGDASNKEILTKAKAMNAKTIVCFSGKDINNMEIAVNIANLIKESLVKPSIYLHLNNRENYELLRSDMFKNVEIKSFNLYDNAAQNLFMKYPLGKNIDTVNGVNRVRIALVGLDKVGESILYRILNLGHFYNQVPIEVDVYDFDIKTKEMEFLKNYPINQEAAKDYWKVKFKDEFLFYTQKLDYAQIIFCSTDSTRSFQDSMRIMKLHSREINENNIEVYLFTDVHNKTGNLVSQDTNDFKNLYTFGNFSELCTYEIIVNESLDEMAKKSHQRYNQLHGYNDSWNELSVFKQDSNRMQVEHLIIKLKVINHYLEKNKKHGNYEDLKQEALRRWFIYGGEMIWNDMKNTKELAEYIPMDVLDVLAQVEHNRWNAFHILYGWKKLTIPQSMTKKAEKDSQLKLHPCLVTWHELDNVSANHKHDYKSDDVETIMRIGDMIASIKETNHFKFIQEFIQNINSIENNFS